MAYRIYNDDCLNWLDGRAPNSITAIVTDPPYGVREYTDAEMEKMRAGKGGIWRLPPSFDGHIRSAVPRFSVINDDPREMDNLYAFFKKWGTLAYNVLVPGDTATDSENALMATMHTSVNEIIRFFMFSVFIG